MPRSSLRSLCLGLTACGVDPVPDTAAQTPSAAAPLAQRGESVVTPDGQFLQVAWPAIATVQPGVRAHSLAAADGARVRYVLGVPSCGFDEIARGTASVHAGGFQVPVDPARIKYAEQSMLIFYIDADSSGTCDRASEPVHYVDVSLGVADLSMPKSSYFNCGFFR